MSRRIRSWAIPSPFLTCLLSAGFISAPPTQADICTWNNTTGNWNDPSRWSCNHEPGAGDTAVISDGAVSVTAAASVDGLNLSGFGTLQGAADLEVTVLLSWTGGTMAGAGKTIVPDGATLSMTGGENKTLTRDIDNGGMATWSGTGDIIATTSTFINLSTGTFTIQNDQVYGSAPAIFSNAGMVIKESGGGLTRMSARFDQSASGVLDVQDGVVRFTEGGTIDGTLTATTTTLRFNNGVYTLAATATITAENVELSGTVTANLSNPNYSVTNTSVTDGTISFDVSITMPNLSLSGGTLQGSGDVEVTNSLSWTGGTMSGTGKTIIPDGATLSMTGGSDKTLTRDIDNGGMATWSGTGNINASTSTLSNLSTGTFTIQNDQVYGVSPAVLSNAGMVVKEGGSGETRISARFDQAASGVLDVQDGVVRVTEGGTIGGTLMATGTTLDFSNGTFSFDSDLSLAVTNLAVTLSSIVDMSNVTDLTFQNVTQSGGTFTLDHPGVVIEGDFVHSGGAFVPGKGRLIFGSGSQQDLSLSVATDFFLLEVTPGTTLVETDPTDHATIVGFLKNRGTIRKTQDIPPNGNVTFGLTNIELDIVNPGTLMSLQIDRVGATHPSAVPPTIREQNWEFLPTGSGFEVDLTIHHCFQPQSELLLCQYTNPTWDCENQMSSATSITQVGVTQFRDTALGSDDYHSMTQFECGNISAWSDVRGLC